MRWSEGRWLQPARSRSDRSSLPPPQRLNLSGEVVGVNTAIDPRGQGLGFAIPINSVKRVVSEILLKGHASHGYAGVSLYPNFDADTAKSLGLKSSDGALIEDVVAGEPAAKSGLKAYDVVTKVGEKRIFTNTDFQKAIRDLSPGTAVKLEFMREGKIANTTLTLGDLTEGLRVANTTGRRSRAGESARPAAKSGMVLEELDPLTRQRWQIEPGVRGLIVSEVQANTPADQAGLARGDILLEMKSERVPRFQKMNTLLDAERILTGRGSYLVKILRGNTPALFTLKI